MLLRFLCILMSVFFIVGCATSRPPSDASSLNMKYRQLERQMEERDEEIRALKEEVRNLQMNLDALENYQLADTLDDPSSISARKSDSSRNSSDVPDKNNKNDIIRVPVRASTVQKALKEAGYYTGQIDGKVGQQTIKAIREFQRDHGLKTDGIVGQNTWKELKGYL